MAALLFLMVLLGLLAAAGIASALGLTPDTRDADYGVGPVLTHRPSTTRL